MIGSPFSRDDPPSPLFCRISFHTGVQHVGWALIKSRPLPLGSSQCPLQENPLRWDKPIFGMDDETDSSFNGRRRKVEAGKNWKDIKEENMADCSSIFRAWRHCGLHCRDDNDANCGSANTVDGAGSISNGRYAVPWLLRCMPDDAAQRGHWHLLQRRWAL
jgi:hypothetical protein